MKRLYMCVFTVTQPTLIFWPRPLTFYGTLSEKNYLDTPFLPSNVVFDV